MRQISRDNASGLFALIFALCRRYVRFRSYLDKKIFSVRLSVTAVAPTRRDEPKWAPFAVMDLSFDHARDAHNA